MFLASIGQVKHKRARDTITAEPTPRSPCPSKKSEPMTMDPLLVRGHAKEPASSPMHSSLSHAEPPNTAQVRSRTSREPCAKTVSSPGSTTEKKSSASHRCHCCETPSSAWKPPASAPYLDRLDWAEARALPTEGLNRPRSAGFGCRPRPGDTSHRSAQKQKLPFSYQSTQRNTHRLGEGREMPRHVGPILFGGTGCNYGGGEGKGIATSRPASAGGFGALRTHDLLEMKGPFGGFSNKDCFGKGNGRKTHGVEEEKKCCRRSDDEGSAAAAATAAVGAGGGEHAQPSQGYRHRRVPSSLDKTNHHRGSTDVKRHTTKGCASLNGKSAAATAAAAAAAAAAAQKSKNAASSNTRIRIDGDSPKTSKDHHSIDTQAWDPQTTANTGVCAAGLDISRARGHSADSTTERGLAFPVADRNLIMRARMRSQRGAAGGGERSPSERPSSAPPGQRHQPRRWLGGKREGGDGGGCGGRGGYTYGGGGGGGGGGDGIGGCGGGGGGGGGAVGMHSLMRSQCR